jgi:RNA polymerase sigma factor (sigma-70 family)
MGDVTPQELDFLTERFEQQRPHLRAVAYRMLGSLTEADDAIQDAWLRLHRTDTDGVGNLDAWLTTVVTRLCLDTLRSRTRRREEARDVYVADPIVELDSSTEQPDEAAVVADSVGLALLVVLDTLAPDERLAFVLHDMFAVPFDEIGPMIDRSPAAARQLASRARRRVRGQAPEPDADLTQQRAVVDAFFAAARDGDLEGLITVLHPDVVLRSDGGPVRAGLTTVLAGAETVAAQAVRFGRLSPLARPALINGAAGVVVADGGTPISIMGFTVVGGRIMAIDVIADPERLDRLDPVGLEN